MPWSYHLPCHRRDAVYLFHETIQDSLKLFHIFHLMHAVSDALPAAFHLAPSTAGVYPDDIDGASSRLQFFLYKGLKF